MNDLPGGLAVAVPGAVLLMCPAVLQLLPPPLPARCQAPARIRAGRC